MKKFTVFCVVCLLAFPLFSQNQAQNAMSVLNYLFTETLTIKDSRYTGWNWNESLMLCLMI
jgi:hypothetical protein